MDEKLKEAILKFNRSKWSKSDALSIAKKGLYEVWFTMVDDIPREESYWIRYTMMVPKTIIHRTEGQSNDEIIGEISKNGGVSMLWFAYSSVNNPNSNFMIKKIFPLNAIEGTKGESIVKVGDSYININGMKGSFKTDIGKEVEWDLRFSEFKEPYNPVPWLAKVLKIATNLWLPAHPNIRASGSITIDGVNKDFSDVQATQTHTFGPKYAYPFIWMHCITFEGEPDAWYDLGYKPLDNKGSIALFDGKTKYYFNKISTMNAIRRVKFDLTGGNLLLEHKYTKITAQWQIPKEALIAVEYIGPLGDRLYCYNTENADLTILIEIKDKEGNIVKKKELKANKGLAFETNWMDPQKEGPDYLPWDQEQLQA